MAERFWPDKHQRDDVEVNEDDWVHLADDDYYGRGYYTDCIIVAVDGKCRGNGQHWARAAAAAYFGPDNDYNKSMMCPDDEPHTSQRAKLWSALMALRTVQGVAARWANISEDGVSLGQAIVKVSSEYVVEGMTEFVKKWMHNGWLNVRQRPLVNQDLFKKLLHQVRTLEGLGVDVRFWHVPKGETWEASELAKRRLDD